jgi:hypothetical protein
VDGKEEIMSDNTKQVEEVRALEAAELEEISGGILRELIVSIYASLIYDRIKEPGPMYKAAVGTLKGWGD